MWILLQNNCVYVFSSYKSIVFIVFELILNLGLLSNLYFNL